MATPVHFIAKPTWEQDCLTLPVDVDGRTVRVFITPEALVRRFGAASNRREDLERSIKPNTDILAIETLVKSLADSGRISATDEVRIDKNDVMAVSFSEKLRRSREFELVARQATRLLEEAIGTSAPKVTALWDLSEDGRAISLQLSDGLVSINKILPLGQLGKQTIADELLFNRVWGNLLRKRSHLQLQELQQLQANLEASWRE